MLNGFLNQLFLPQAMLGVGLAFVTALISAAIFMFSNEKDFLFEWDKIVILDYVVRARNTLIYMSAIFLPLLFWDSSNNLFKIIFLILFVWAVYGLVVVLNNVYRWLKVIELEGDDASDNSFRNKARDQYLGKLEDGKELEVVWKSIWSREQFNNIFQERKFIEKFIETNDRFFHENSLENATKLISNFRVFLGVRSLYDWSIFENIFKSVLRWNFKIYKKGQNDFYELDSSIKFIIRELTKTSLEKGTSYSFFKILKEHIKESQEEKKYVEVLLNLICRDFFDNIKKSRSSYTVWEHDFPKEWKIRLNNIEENIPSIWLNCFWQWALSRMQTHQEFDSVLEDVTRNLFPTVEPTTWAKLLIFRANYTPDVTAHIKYVIDTPWTFGFIGRSVAYSGPAEESDDIMWKKVDKKTAELERKTTYETFQLAKKLFGNLLSKRAILGYIKELKSLEEVYRKESLQYKKIRQLINIFENFLNFIKEDKDNNS